MYIAIINIHGLVRRDNIEMGRDADTGGQTRYVIDMVKELANRKDVEVDLFTRRLNDKKVGKEYQAKFEKIGDNAKIVRLNCGGSKYIRKEKLWPYLDEYVDNLIAYFRKQKKIPTLIHGHYADGGYVATEIAYYFHIPLVFTGHSLGRNKAEYLTKTGISKERLEQYYNMSTRIGHEERTLRNADLVITSTDYERKELYKSYENHLIEKFQVIPPGLDLDKFFPYYHFEIKDPAITEEQKQAQFSMIQELQRFFTNFDKPIILALCRPEARKNIDLLIKIYGKSDALQALANLAIFAGIRDDINSMEEGEKEVLTDMLLLMDRYDLYGKMAIPKHHNPERDVPELYRIAALKHGIFVSAAALENFGLTFIEAAAVGLPFIGTNRGGVQDIQKNCDCGLLVDIDNQQKLHDAMVKLLTDQKQWNTLSEHGIERVAQIYNWKTHCDTYLKHLQSTVAEFEEKKAHQGIKDKNFAKRVGKLDYLFISDIDNTITGDDAALEELRMIIEHNRDRFGFGIATGRSLESAKELLDYYELKADLLITAVGSEIYYGKNLIADKGWSSFIRRRWHPIRIKEALKEFSGLHLQEEAGSQRPYKISYNIAKDFNHEELLVKVTQELEKTKSAFKLIISHEKYLDILPYRASKGSAVKYIAWKWQLGNNQIITAGDSGNDSDMLTKPFKAIVVANHEESLNSLKKDKNVYFAKEKYAKGVIEALKHYAIIK